MSQQSPCPLAPFGGLGLGFNGQDPPLVNGGLGISPLLNNNPDLNVTTVQVDGARSCIRVSDFHFGVGAPGRERNVEAIGTMIGMGSGPHAIVTTPSSTKQVSVRMEVRLSKTPPSFSAPLSSALYFAVFCLLPCPSSHLFFSSRLFCSNNPDK